MIDTLHTDVQILQGHVLAMLKKLKSQSVHCVVTSPPYWQLRDYGFEGQMGLEKDPKTFIRNLVKVFRQVRRVLRDDGNLWLNLGSASGTSARTMCWWKASPTASPPPASWPASSKASSTCSGPTKYSAANGPTTSSPPMPPRSGKTMPPYPIINPRYNTFNERALEQHGWEMRFHRDTREECWIKKHPVPKADGTTDTLVVALRRHQQGAMLLFGNQCLGQAKYVGQVERVLKAIELNLNPA
jgi:hypothetical protein